MKIEYPRPEGIPVSHLPFSPATVYGDLIFVSGQASVDKTGKIITDTFEGEVRRSIENLLEVLKYSGSDRHHILKLTAYVDKPENVAEYNRIYREYFSEPYPARTTVSGTLGGSLKFEIDCIAIKTPQA